MKKFQLATFSVGDFSFFFSWGHYCFSVGDIFIISVGDFQLGTFLSFRLGTLSVGDICFFFNWGHYRFSVGDTFDFHSYAFLGLYLGYIA